MVQCTNCGKQLRDNVAYCRICGTRLDGGEPDDYSTGLLNVFLHGDGYIYLFSETGNQVVLKADTLDDLEAIVKKKRYPWQFSDSRMNVIGHDSRDTEEQDSTSDFMKASTLDEDKTTGSSSTGRKSDESYVPDYVVEKVENESEGSDAQLKNEKDYVESIYDVGFGKIMDRNLTGCVPTVWGPDNSQRAISLRQSMFK